MFVLIQRTAEENRSITRKRDFTASRLRGKWKGIWQRSMDERLQNPSGGGYRWPQAGDIDVL
jgi:hypothetical protein